MFVRRISGKISKIIKENEGKPLALELIDGQIYAGLLDDYLPGTVVLLECLRLDKRNKRWIDQVEGKKNFLLTRALPRGLCTYFNRRKIKAIFVVRTDAERDIFLKDFLQCLIDPHYTPLASTMCDWPVTKRPHKEACDAKLHEALSNLWTFFLVADIQDASKRKSLISDFEYIRSRLLQYGAKIP